MQSPGRTGYGDRTERKESPLMARTLTLDPERVVVGAPHRDNSGLRARLSGQTSGEIVVEVTPAKRWR